MKSKNEVERKRLRWELITLVCMYLGYVSFMICRNTAIVASPAMIADPELGMSKTLYGQMMAYHSAGGVFGKAVCGIAVDRFGGRLMFMVTLGLTALTTTAFGLCSRFGMLAGLNFLGQGAKSGGWPAMASLIRSWYSPDKHGRVWGVISTSSRVGVMTATMFLGYLLTFLSWRSLFHVSAAIALTLVVVCFFFLRRGPEEVGLAPPQVDSPGESAKHRLDGSSFAQACKVFAASPRVWLICLSMAFTTVLMDVLNFIPLYLTESLGLDPGQAGMATTSFPAGCFVAVLAAGYVYDTLSRRRRVWVLGGLLGSGLLATATLYLLPRAGLPSGLALAIALAAIFMSGLAVAPAYYLPMSVFSISYGGPHCGFLICLFDVFGYLGAVVYNFFGGGIIDNYGWGAFLGMMAAVTAAATVTMTWFLILDYRAEASRTA